MSYTNNWYTSPEYSQQPYSYPQGYSGSYAPPPPQPSIGGGKKGSQGPPPVPGPPPPGYPYDGQYYASPPGSYNYPPSTGYYAQAPPYPPQPMGQYPYPSQASWPGPPSQPPPPPPSQPPPPKPAEEPVVDFFIQRLLKKEYRPPANQDDETLQKCIQEFRELDRDVQEATRRGEEYRFETFHQRCEDISNKWSDYCHWVNAKKLSPKFTESYNTKFTNPRADNGASRGDRGTSQKGNKGDAKGDGKGARGQGPGQTAGKGSKFSNIQISDLPVKTGSKKKQVKDEKRKEKEKREADAKAKEALMKMMAEKQAAKAGESANPSETATHPDDHDDAEASEQLEDQE